MEILRKTFNGSFDPFWRGEAKMLPAGYMPEGDIPAYSVVMRGTPVEIDTDTLTCKIAKSAYVIDGGDATNLRVEKGHLFVVGDVITDGSTSGEEGEETTNTATITAIDTSNSDYDVLTIDTSLSGTSVYTDCEPNAVVGANYENTGLGVLTLDIAYEVCLLYKALPFPLADAWKDGINLKGNHQIKLITQ